ncbi:MAG: hypothetical protein KY453_09910 [Gemmatimonadetes bacterium]|nr:hypothetical protein [Gemmatimonadota bacterium]
MLEGRSSAPFLPALEADGVPIDDVFAFISSLYFRGKRRYARAFARPPGGVEGVHVITSGRGLVAAGTRVTLDDLAALAAVDISLENPGYVGALTASAERLRRAAGPACDVVLLGSLATGKYVEPLLEVFEERLRVPEAFVGRGDMSRGGLLLRCVDEGKELDYRVVRGLDRRGPRPPRLPRVGRAP